MWAAEILALITLWGRRGLSLKRKLIHRVDGWRAGRKGTVPPTVAPAQAPGYRGVGRAGPSASRHATSQSRALLTPAPCSILFSIPRTSCQMPHFRVSVDTASSQAMCSVTIYCVPGTTLTGQPWEGDSMTHEGSGCPLSSAGSPGPSSATQLVRWAGFGPAFPVPLGTLSPPETSPSIQGLQALPPPLPHSPALLPAIPHSWVSSAACGICTPPPPLTRPRSADQPPWRPGPHVDPCRGAHDVLDYS